MEYLLFVYIICFIGFLFILHFVYLFIVSRNTQKWLSTMGKINNSKMEIIYQDIGNDRNASYKAKVEYQYVINGNTYFSKKIFIGDYTRRNFPFSVKSFIKNYTKDKEVLVYYNPTDFKSSVLETGVHSIIYRELFAGILFVVLSIIMITKESFFVSLIQ